jgi:drug/metabolite transporter (DMT)-like permease
VDNTQQAGSERKGLAEILSSALIWGSIPVFAIWAGLPSPVFVFFRVTVSGILLAVILRKGFKNTLSRMLNPYVFMSGILLSLNWVFLFYAVFLIPVSEAIIFYYTGPVIAILLSPFIREKITLKGYINVAIAITGVTVMSAGTLSINPVGILIALLSGITYGMLSIFSKISSRYTDPISLVFLQSVISMIILSPFMFLLSFHFDYRILIIVIISGAIQTVLALFLWYDSMRHISIQLVSILTYLDPVFAIIFALLLLHQVPGIYTLTGAVLLIGSGVWAASGTIKKRPVISMVS